MSFHLPERVGHSRDKAPLALHIGFQIFCALPVNLPDCLCALGNSNPLFYKASKISEITFSPLFFTFIL